jgi:hypothetical protein
MATSKPRITITLDRGLYGVVYRLSRAQGRPMSGLVVELLQEMAPILERAMLLCEAAARAPAEAKARFREAAEQAEVEILPALEQAQASMDKFSGSLGCSPGRAGGWGAKPTVPPVNPRASNHGGQVPLKRAKSHRKGG